MWLEIECKTFEILVDLSKGKIFEVIIKRNHNFSPLISVKD